MGKVTLPNRAKRVTEWISLRHGRATLAWVSAE